jgi:hypothetical protein
VSIVPPVPLSSNGVQPPATLHGCSRAPDPHPRSPHQVPHAQSSTASATYLQVAAHHETRHAVACTSTSPPQRYQSEI